MKILQLIAVMLLLSLASCNSKPKAVPKQPCPDCCGTRYTDTIFCTNCEGTGEVKCEYCDGKGLLDPCSRCGGGHEIPCPDCGETGLDADGAPCSHCEGTGHVVCPSCYGAHDKCECVHSGLFKPGWLPCPKCDGEGKIYVECKTCNGTGRI